MLHSKKVDAQTQNEQRGIIAITEQNGKQTVDARELHRFLTGKRQFANWIKSRIEDYGFVENEDFTSFNKFVKRRKGGSVRKEYTLSLDMAKELAMVERNEKGRQARRYFIEAEKKLREILLQEVAIVAPFMGVSPLVENGKAWYCYLSVLKAIGNSTTSGSVAERKRRYPNQFKMFFGRNFVSKEFCEFLQKTRELRQLQLDLFNDQKTLQ